jgi:hypothetical protein
MTLSSPIFQVNRRGCRRGWGWEIRPGSVGTDVDVGINGHPALKWAKCRLIAEEGGSTAAGLNRFRNWSGARLEGLRHGSIVLALMLWGAAAHGQLALVSDVEPPCVFAGAGREISMVWRNPGTQPVEVALRMRLYEASTATAAVLGDAPWKTLQVLPGQTVLASAVVSFPDVWAETLFVVQWVDATNRVWGVTTVRVFPVNLLKDLKPLVGEGVLGVLDPQNQVKPLLQSAGVAYVDLGEMTLEHFQGRLAILGPFNSRPSEGFAQRVRKMAQNGASAVWIQPLPDRRDALKPSFYTVREGAGTVVVTQPALVSNLAERPQSQNNLVRLAALALNPQPLSLPGLADGQ